MEVYRFFYFGTEWTNNILLINGNKNLLTANKVVERLLGEIKDIKQK